MFGDITDEFFNEFGKLDRIFEGLFEEMNRPIHLGGDNLYYGVSVYVGPDGKPIVKEYGNFNPRTKDQLLKSGIKEPFTDIEEREKEIVITAELPGVQKDNIKIDVTEETIEIKTENKKDREADDYIIRKDTNEYRGSYKLPSPVNPRKAKARYKNGVLEVTLPKAEIKKATHVKVE